MRRSCGTKVVCGDVGGGGGGGVARSSRRAETQRESVQCATRARAPACVHVHVCVCDFLCVCACAVAARCLGIRASRDDSTRREHRERTTAIAKFPPRHGTRVGAGERDTPPHEKMHELEAETSE